jgi:hypothetical protein
MAHFPVFVYLLHNSMDTVSNEMAALVSFFNFSGRLEAARFAEAQGA